MKPKVSVVIPTFNMSATIGKAIDSVFSQTYSNFELIVVDDGSRDNTRSCLGNSFNKIPSGLQFTYLFQENQGRSIALNNGIKRSKGDYITFLDADDTFTDDSLEVRVNYLKENPDKEAVFADSNYINGKGEIYSIRRAVKFRNEKELAMKLLSRPKAPLSENTFMYRRYVFDKIGYFDPVFERAEDADFAFRLLYNCSVGYLPHTVYNFNTASHDTLTRLRNRVKDGIGKMNIIKNNSKGPEKIYLYPNMFFITLLKLSYEIFSSKK